jgi:hypothetical protein
LKALLARLVKQNRTKHSTFDIKVARNFKLSHSPPPYSPLVARQTNLSAAQGSAGKDLR